MKYINTIGFIIVFLLTSVVAQAQQVGGNVTGTVVDKNTKEPIAHVQVFVKGTTLGTTTDTNGNYSLKNIPAGQRTIVAKFVGYSTCEEKVHIENGTARHLDLYLNEEVFSLDGVVVSANRNETLRRQAPSLVTVLSSDLFLKTNSTNLTQGLKFQPGLRVEDNCQNCGFNQVRINGLEGSYSQILIDSHPIFSALAGVYGLEQLPANMVERVEVIRGGGSALFGSNAVGGVINVITKEPLRNYAEISHSTMTFNHDNKGWGAFQNTTQFNGSVLTEDRKAGVMVFGQHNYRPGQDIDGDSFTELPNLRNRSLGFRSYYKTSPYGKVTLEYHSMQEYRRGGDRLDAPPFEARIAEYLQHYINGGSLRYDQNFRDGKDFISLYLSAQDVQRRSYYGGGDHSKDLLDPLVNTSSTNTPEYEDAFRALTSYGLTKGLDMQFGGMYRHTFGENWDFTGGIEYTNSKLDDRSGYRPNKIDQNTFTWSQYDQLEYKTEKFSALIGGRFDFVRLFQNNTLYIDPVFSFSPRANVRYNPIQDLSFRLSYSEGFRAPQYFDEDLHVELAGGTPISRVLASNLKEERSRSISASFDWYHRADEWQFNVMGEGFTTFISNQFKPSDTEKTINGEERTIRTIYNDKEGVAKVYGVNLEGRVAYNNLFDIQLGGTWQRSLYGSLYTPIEEDSKTGQKEISVKEYLRTPNLYGYFVATLRPTEHFAINLSGTLTGSMNVVHEAYEGDIPAEKIGPNGAFDFVKDGTHYKGLAEGHTALIKTPSFFDIDLKLSHDFHLGSTMVIELNGGIQNIFNSYQKDFDKGPGRASTYVYGPMLPRRIFIGTKISF